MARPAHCLARSLGHGRRLAPALVHHCREGARGHLRVGVGELVRHAASRLDLDQRTIEVAAHAREYCAVDRTGDARLDEAGEIEHGAVGSRPLRIVDRRHMLQVLLGGLEVSLVGRRQAQREVRAEGDGSWPGRGCKRQQLRGELSCRAQLATREAQPPLAE